MLKKILTSIFLFSFVVACGSNKDNETEVATLSLNQSDVTQTHQKLIELDQADVLNQVFTFTPEEDLRLIQQAIEKALSGLQILRRFVNEKKLLERAYNDLSTSVYLIDSFNLLQINDDRVNRVFNDIRVFKSTLARDLGKQYETWVLYKNNFADGIEPEFRAPGGKDTFGDINWDTNFQIDIPKAKIQARDGYAWLVSRSFDLRNVTAPAFRFHASYLVTSPDAENTLFEVIQKVFKTYIILDLKPNESLEDLPDSRKILVEYSPDEVPKARDFHDDWLPLRSLDKYKDHKVSIGFLFDTREINYKQFYGWDIFDFELVGAGSFKISPYLYQPRLNEKLGGFQSLTQTFSGEEWLSGGEGAYINSSRDKDTDSVLISPLIAMGPKPYQKKQGLSLHLSESFRNINYPSAAQVLISTDYRVGQPFDYKNQNWKQLERLNPLGKDQHFDLGPYLNKDFFIAFRFVPGYEFTPKSGDTKKIDEPASWDIHYLAIESIGSSVNPIPFFSPDANDNVEPIKTFDFLNDNFREYEKVYYTTDDSANWKKNTKGVNISAYNGQDEPAFKGASRLNTKAIILPEERNVVRLQHTIGFLNNPGPLKIQIREVCKVSFSWCYGEWKDIDFPDSTFRRIDEPEYSTWVEIDDRYKGKEVEFSFFYQGQGKNNPNWTLILFEVAQVQQ